MALTLDELTKDMNDAIDYFVNNDICFICGAVHCEKHKDDDVFLYPFMLNGDI